MQTLEKITNPLGLDLVWAVGVQQVHDAHDADKVAALAADMNTRGWAGAPLIASRSLHECGQDRAYTGSHRWQAWQDSAHAGEPMPCVFIEDLAAEHGIDFEDLVDEHGSDYTAAAKVGYLLPADIVDAYGLDLEM